MFQYATDSSFSSVREYQNLAEFFDPRINKVWTDSWDKEKINAEIFHNALKTLPYHYLIKTYAYHTIGSRIFDYILHSQWEGIFNQFFERIPQEHMIGMFYCSIRKYDSASNRIEVEHYNFSDNPLTSIGYRGIAATDQKRKYFTPSEFSEFLSTYSTKLNNILSQTHGHVIHRQILPGTFAQFYTEFSNFLFARKSYRLNGTNVFNEAVANIPLSNLIKYQGYSEQDIINGLWPNLSITQKVTKDYRTPLYNILSYNTAATDLIEWPIVEKHEKNPILYGVELETASKYNVKQIIDAQVIPFFIAKNDSSITGNGSTKSELVTVPMSLKAHKKHWANWFKNINYDQFDCTKDTNNGMHVHIDRKAFMNEHHLKNMVWFYTQPCNTDFLIYISERGSMEKMRNYSPIIQYPTHLTKIQCYKQCVSQAAGARGIINLMKGPTVEIRMFRGLVSFGELCKNLEFVDAVFHFCEGERSVNKLSFVDFLQWLDKQPINRYILLRKFIDQCKNLEAMMKEAEVKNIIFNITDPKLVAQRMNKYAEAHKLRLTNAHVSILNRGQKRRFILNKDTGLVDVTVTNLSKFAPFDREIEARYTRQAIA